MTLFEISNTYAPVLALLFPLIPLLLVAMITYLSKSRPSNRFVRYLSHLISSPKLKSSENPSELSQQERKALFKRTLGIQIALVYVAIFMFIACNILAEFYNCWIDVIQPMQGGSTGELRTWSSIVIMNPFSSGWMGSLPWYDATWMFPPAGLDIYHDVWGYVFFTGGITDNPELFIGFVLVKITLGLLVGFLFSVPLFLRRIRESFFPSIFYLTTAMLVMTRSLFGCFAQAWKLQFGGDVLTYGLIQVTGEMTPFTGEVLMYLSPLIAIFYVLFMGIGWKLSGIQYPDSILFRRWVMLFLSVVFWMSLVYGVVTP